MAAERPTCKTCPYWAFFDPSTCEVVEDIETASGDDLEDNEGQCRRCPPARLVYNGFRNGGRSVLRTNEFPEVFHYDWCGEHPDFPAYLAALRADPAPPPRTDSTPSG
jgi:hypothetical protein